MECPDCGYLMTAFETHCPRCKRLGGEAARKRCPDCGRLASAVAVACEGCGHDYRPPAEPEAAPPEAEAEPPAQRRFSRPRSVPPRAALRPSPAALRDASPAPPVAALPVGALGCPVCGGADTQKVSALYEAGTWTARTSGTSETVGVVFDGPLFVAGTASVQHTSGGSRLAHALAPPPRPLGPAVRDWDLFGGMLCLGGGVWLAYASLPWCIILVGIPFFLTGCVMAVVGAVALLRFVNNASLRERAASALPFWEQQIGRYEQLFYCGRCDHVFHPVTREAAASSQMGSLLGDGPAGLLP